MIFVRLKKSIESLNHHSTVTGGFDPETP